MFCTRCGKELPEGANVCSSCGERIEKENSNTDVKSLAGQKTRQAASDIQDKAKLASAGVQGKYQEFKEEREKTADAEKSNSVAAMFVSADEQLHAVIKGGYIRNILSGAGLSQEVGAVTDKRLYYRGNNYSSTGSGKEDCTVDLQDVTSTGFTYHSSIIYIVISVIHLVAGIILAIIAEHQGPLILLGVLALLWLIGYFKSKHTIYVITYGGGSLGMNVSYFGLESIRTFDRKLHMAKDARLEGGRLLGGGNC